MDPPMDRLEKLSQSMPALGAAFARRILGLAFRQVASSRTNARGGNAQTFGHSLGRFTFTDKRICARGKGSLLTGVQVADENNDQRGWAGAAELIQSSAGGRTGEQSPI